MFEGLTESANNWASKTSKECLEVAFALGRSFQCKDGNFSLFHWSLQDLGRNCQAATSKAEKSEQPLASELVTGYWWLLLSFGQIPPNPAAFFWESGSYKEPTTGGMPAQVCKFFENKPFTNRNLCLGSRNKRLAVPETFVPLRGSMAIQ